MDKQRLSQKDKLFKPHRHDPYQSDEKQPNAICHDCGASYAYGRWSWKAPELGADAQISHCPACRRIAEGAAAAVIEIVGEFSTHHQQEICALIRNTEAREKSEHVLERLLKVDVSDAMIRVETTGEHLARRIGHALSDSFDGSVHYHYDDHRRHLLVRWQR